MLCLIIIAHKSRSRQSFAVCQILQKVEAQREPELVSPSQRFLAPKFSATQQMASLSLVFSTIQPKLNFYSHFLKTPTPRNMFFYLCTSAAARNLDEDDNTKAEAAKMQKEYENLKDSTKEEQPSTATSQSTAQTR